MNRRDFFGALAGAGLAGLELTACGPAAANPAGRGSLERLGVQLYTVRDRMQHDVVGTLHAVADIGYLEVETAGLFGLSPSEFRAALDGAGLVSPAAHVSMDALRGDAAATFAAAETLGQTWLVVPWIDRAERTSDGYTRFAGDLNRFGSAARERGLRIAYHNHEFEFDALDDGRTGYAILLAETEPEFVDLELDLFWAVRGGHDPVDLFAAHRGRFTLWHVKDMADIAGSPRMVSVGEGEIDFARIFAHAELAGMRHFFVEHDNPADALASIRAAHAHLRQLRF
jgi:sugar phosphate isomerase/epimerase